MVAKRTLPPNQAAVTGNCVRHTWMNDKRPKAELTVPVSCVECPEARNKGLSYTLSPTCPGCGTSKVAHRERTQVLRRLVTDNVQVSYDREKLVPCFSRCRSIAKVISRSINVR